MIDPHFSFHGPGRRWARTAVLLALGPLVLIAVAGAPVVAADVGPLAPPSLRCPGLVDLDASRPGPDYTFAGWNYQWETFSTAPAEPMGVAVDASCNVYVADYAATGGTLVKLSKTGDVLATWGTPGRGVGQLERLEGVAVDGAGNVYAADSGNNRVQRFTPAGSVNAVWASASDCVGVSVPCTSVPDDLHGSLAVQVDGAGNLLVVDGSYGVKKFNASGAFLTQWGTPLSGAPGGFAGADGIAVDGSGNAYVADALNNRVQAFDTTGKLIKQFTVTDASLIPMSNPHGVAVDPSGSVYVADTDNQRIVVFDPTGQPVSWAGRCLDDQAATPCPNTTIGDGPGEFAQPHHLAADGRGELFVADRFNHRIEVLKAYPIWQSPNS